MRNLRNDMAGRSIAAGFEISNGVREPYSRICGGLPSPGSEFQEGNLFISILRFLLAIGIPRSAPDFE
jgi:hypothetical protein